MVTARPWFVAALTLVLVLGTALRVFAFDVVPTGLNNHEASTGFDALALARLGTDRWGHPWPVYFPAWGSGMNALASYLVAPLILWLGLEPIALRLPALVHGLLSLPLVYILGRTLFDRPTALCSPPRCSQSCRGTSWPRAGCWNPTCCRSGCCSDS